MPNYWGKHLVGWCPSIIWLVSSYFPKHTWQAFSVIGFPVIHICLSFMSPCRPCLSVIPVCLSSCHPCLPVFLSSMSACLPVIHVRLSSCHPYLHVFLSSTSACFMSSFSACLPVIHVCLSSCHPYLFVSLSSMSACFLPSMSSCLPVPWHHSSTDIRYKPHLITTGWINISALQSLSLTYAQESAAHMMTVAPSVRCDISIQASSSWPVGVPDSPHMPCIALSYNMAVLQWQTYQEKTIYSCAIFALIASRVKTLCSFINYV